MHMTCPAHYQSCLWERERERERQCEDSDALYKSCNKKISQYRWKTVFRRKIWKSVCVCFSFHKNKTKEHRLVWIKSEADGNERIYRWRTALSVVKASTRLRLGTVVSRERRSHRLFELHRTLVRSGESKTHADMQTQPERGQQEVWPYVDSHESTRGSSNKHTLQWKSSSNGRRSSTSPRESSSSVWSFLLFSSFSSFFLIFFFIFYMSLFAPGFVGSYLFILRPPELPAAHTLMGRVWLICCRTISWLLSGLFLLCPGSVPPSRSRSLRIKRQAGQQRVHRHFKSQH